jgi:hypothetical protein
MPNMPLRRVLITVLLLVAAPAASLAAAPPKYRTDQGEDKSLPWYRPEPGKFPPPGSAHAIPGELIAVDHLERRFSIRADRNDSQQAGQMDLPLDGVMLPYGSIYFHGAPAALQDIPLGTHLHGQFYPKDPADKSDPPKDPRRRMTAEAAFSRCFVLEDDFSHYARLKQIWKIEDVKPAEKKLTATLQQDGKAVGKPQVFDLLGGTRVLSGHGFATVGTLRPGQLVQFNINWATLYGPGRIADVWTDEPARELAAAQQLERHRDHVRDRGLPGWIDAVDDDKQVVTITFFGGVDSALFDELNGIDETPHGWPFSGREDDPKAPKGGICVSRASLMTYDPLNDRKGGNILHIGKVPPEPGSSGVQIQVKCCQLLEGFRPGHIVRFYPATWKVNALPHEEQFHGPE